MLVFARAIAREGRFMYTTHYTIDLREFDFDFSDLDKAGFPEYAPHGFRDPIAQSPMTHAYSMTRQYRPP